MWFNCDGDIPGYFYHAGAGAGGAGDHLTDSGGSVASRFQFRPSLAIPFALATDLNG